MCQVCGCDRAVGTHMDIVEGAPQGFVTFSCTVTTDEWNRKFYASHRIAPPKRVYWTRIDGVTNV
jgi:hypothetical protein